MINLGALATFEGSGTGRRRSHRKREARRLHRRTMSSRPRRQQTRGPKIAQGLSLQTFGRDRRRGWLNPGINLPFVACFRKILKDHAAGLRGEDHREYNEAGVYSTPRPSSDHMDRPRSCLPPRNPLFLSFSFISFHSAKQTLSDAAVSFYSDYSQITPALACLSARAGTTFRGIRCIMGARSVVFIRQKCLYSCFPLPVATVSNSALQNMQMQSP